MKLVNKIAFWSIAMIIAIPGIAMLLNDNEANFVINFIGLAYLFFGIKLAKKYMPQEWIDYFDKEPDLGDEFKD